MIAVLTGDKGSAGDALIVKRGLRILEKFLPNEKILKIDRWKPIDAKLEEVNASRALLLMGGPAFERDIYPGVYPLVNDLDKIKVPIVAMGLGSNLLPFNSTTIRNFRFTPSSQPLLQRLSSDHQCVGVRDAATLSIAQGAGLQNASIIGCPAWFNLDELGKPVGAKQIKTVAFAPGVRYLYYRSQASFDQHVAVMKFLKGTFSDARLVCIVQDTLEKDSGKPEWMIGTQRRMADIATSLGFEVIDCTNNVDKMISTYNDTDLLVGYRVHSHICMLSLGHPAVLIAEDSRGYSLNAFAGLQALSSFEENRGLLNTFFATPATERYARRLFPYRVNSFLLEELQLFLEEELSNGFVRYSSVHQVILSYFEKMSHFVRNLPS